MARQNGPQFNRRSTAAKLRRIERELMEALDKVPEDRAPITKEYLSRSVGFLQSAVLTLQSDLIPQEFQQCP